MLIAGLFCVQSSKLKRHSNALGNMSLLRDFRFMRKGSIQAIKERNPGTAWV
jgi:hypothetical protein